MDYMCFLRDVRDAKVLPVFRRLASKSSRRQGSQTDPVHLRFVGGQHNATYHHVKKLKKKIETLFNRELCQ